MKRPVKFGDYYLFQRIAVGGMAEVFRAASYGVEAFERVFAVKRVLPQIAEDQEFIDMFIDEAKIAVQLSHANIGQVFELGNAEDSYFIAMEFVSGKDSRAVFDRMRSRGERLDISMCCHIVKEVCEALEYAHNKRNEVGDPLNLIHRDVSPQNILISYEGEVKLIDFGIAKAAGKANKTQSGILKGKFGYMSPEQVRGKPIDGRSDLFSLATVLYELLTLERCFQGVDDFSTLEKVRKVDFKRPTLLNRAIPPELERIIYRGLTRNPTDRFQSAAEFQDALQKYLYQSGSFYSRKDLSQFMKETFARELNAENEDMASFRRYAKENIIAATRDGTIPEEDLSMDSLVDSVELDVSELVLSDSDTDTDRDISLLDRTTEQSQPRLKRLPPDTDSGGYPSDAATIPRNVEPLSSDVELRPKRKPVKVDTGRRLAWLLIVTVLAIVAGLLTVMREIDELTPGSLRLETNTNSVQLYINGRLRHEGQVPIVIDKLTPGRHALSIQAKGFLGVSKSVVIEPGVQKPIRLSLESDRPKTSLTLTTLPAGAMVYIDGQKIDETPAKIPDITPGKRQLRLEKSGYSPYQGSINIAEGTSARIDPIRLYPETVTLIFVAEPSEATIAVKNANEPWRTLGQSPQTVPGIPNTGQLSIRVSAPGYQTLERLQPKVFTLRHEEIVALEVKPKPRSQKNWPSGRGQTRSKSHGAKASAQDSKNRKTTYRNPSFCRVRDSSLTALSVDSRPKSRVFIDGAELGWAPIVKKRVAPGYHSVLLERQTPPVFKGSFNVHVATGKELVCIYRKARFNSEK
ncbi:MAG: serine/threonine-protein kinase [Myxococcota bacterium]|nr:serine/threonine-protein kinase [Myxococcota bacterium]